MLIQAFVAFSFIFGAGESITEADFYHMFRKIPVSQALFYWVYPKNGKYDNEVKL